VLDNTIFQFGSSRFKISLCKWLLF
jgi:hypothetical protein